MIPLIFYVIPAFIAGLITGKKLPHDPPPDRRDRIAIQHCVIDRLDANKHMTLDDAIEECTDGY